MSTTSHYNEFSAFLKRYPPHKVQKTSLNVGFTRPNYDGNKGYSGYTYHNNQVFNPDYCRVGKSMCLQLEEGKRLLTHKYSGMKYLTYFQVYTNTYDELESLKRKYEGVLSVEGVIGLIIGTHSDCMPGDLLRYLGSTSKHTSLLIEYDVESTRDETLRRANHGHTFQATAGITRRTAACGISTGEHVALGLPGEAHQNIVARAHDLSQLPPTTLKIHQLQLIRGTRMALEYKQNLEDFHLFDVEEYVDLVIDYVEHLHPNIALERFVSQPPKDLLIALDRGLKNYESNHRAQKRMKEPDAYQGKRYEM